MSDMSASGPYNLSQTTTADPQDGSPTSRRRSFYLFLMPDAFPSMPLTDAQAAVKAGEAVLA